MYNLNGEPMNENTYSSPTGGMNGSYSYNPQGNTDGNYTYNASPSAPYPTNQMNQQGPKKSGVCGILGLVFSILAFPLGWFIPIVGILLAIAGVVLSIIGCNKQRAARGTGIAGLIISIIALIALIVLVVVRVINYANAINDIYDPFQDEIQNAIEDLEDMEDQLNDMDDMDDMDFDFDDDDSDYSEYEVSHSWSEEDSVINDIDDVVLLETESFKITATELVYESIGDDIYPYVNITIENRSNNDIGVTTPYCAVNGVVIGTYVADDVMAGQTMETDLCFDILDYRLAGLSTIDSISCMFDVYDPDTYDSLFTDEETYHFVFDESAEDFSITDRTSEAPVFSEADCDVYFLGTADKYDDGSDEFLFYVDNRSSDMVCVTLDGLYINGESHSGALDIDDIDSGNGIFFTLAPDTDVDFNSVTDAKMTVDIIDAEYNTLFNGEVTFLP